MPAIGLSRPFDGRHLPGLPEPFRQRPVRKLKQPGVTALRRTKRLHDANGWLPVAHTKVDVANAGLSL